VSLSPHEADQLKRWLIDQFPPSGATHSLRFAAEIASQIFGREVGAGEIIEAAASLGWTVEAEEDRFKPLAMVRPPIAERRDGSAKAEKQTTRVEWTDDQKNALLELLRSGADSFALRVFYVIVEKWNGYEGKSFTLSTGQLAKFAGVSPRTAETRRNELVRLGAIQYTSLAVQGLPGVFTVVEGYARSCVGGTHDGAYK
jgi:hypothetical protein